MVSRFATASCLPAVVRERTDLLERAHRQLDQKPWLNAEGDVIWEPWRVRLGEFMLSDAFDLALAIIILFNVALIIFETDQEAKCYPSYKDDLDNCPWAGTQYVWLTIANNVLLSIYTLEVVLNMLVWRRAYFTKKMYQFDLLVCMSGWATLVFSSLMRISWLRILRIGRLIRNLKYLNSIPELYMLSAGFVGAMNAMFFGGFVLVGLLGFFSILLVQLIHPINADIYYGPSCERCDRGFESIKASMLTLFQQIIAGDSWGLISVPIVEESRWGVLLPFTQMVIGIGAMNLILAVVVDRSVEARETNHAEKALEELKEHESHKQELLDLLDSMDVDKSGTINKGEVVYAVECSPDFSQKMHKVGLVKADILEIVDSLQGKSGEISYNEFCDAVDNIETADVRKHVVLLKMNLLRMKREIIEQLRKQDHAIHRQSEMLESLHKLFGLGGGWPFASDMTNSAKPKDDVLGTFTADTIEPCISSDNVLQASTVPTNDACQNNKLLATDPSHELFAMIESCQNNNLIGASKTKLSPNSMGESCHMPDESSSPDKSSSPKLPSLFEVGEYMSEISLCEGRVVREARDAHESLRRLENCWIESIDMLADRTFAMNGTSDRNTRLFLDETLKCVSRQHRCSQVRRRISFQQLAKDLDGDIASLQSYCKLLKCRSSESEGMHVDNADGDSSILPLSPRSPRVPWRFMNTPRTP